MSKQRAINTKFWSDPWVRDELNPLDRYLFLYFLTNEHTNISGVYELPIATIAFETGIDREELERAMIKRLRPKVIYHRSWVVLPNFPKHQNLKSPDVLKGIEREFASAPEQVQKEAISRGWGDGLGMVYRPPEVLNLTKPNSISVANAPQIVEISEENPQPKSPRYTKDYNELCDWMEKLTGVKFVDRRGQFKALKIAREADLQPGRLKARAEELWPKLEFKGMDWFDVVYSFNKKA